MTDEQSAARIPGTDAPEEGVFEIGLVMAGAISAGAYTAGVLDFLNEALACWEEARARDPENTPPHRVRIKVMSGASAGGICAAIAAAEAAGKASGDPARGKLYESWVERIDIEKLLTLRDIDHPDAEVVSLLDSTELDAIALDALDLVPRDLPAWYAEPFHIYLALANLRGIPYAIREDVSEDADDPANLYEMTLHADYLHFAIGGDSSFADGEGSKPWSTRGIHWLDPSALGIKDRRVSDPAWALLRDAALSTSAFPVGLAPRSLARPRADYDNRRWAAARLDPQSGWTVDMRPRPPNWPRLGTWADEYRFHTVDGGVMDNEPLELARRQLAGPRRHNPRSATKARRAVVMVDPFPDASPVRPDELPGGVAAPNTSAYRPRLDFLSILGETFSALIRQARFKKEEMLLAEDETVFSRFMVAPTRSDRGKDDSIASAAMGGFGGFFDQSFREHDYRLGRRNCQQFLRRHFVLDAENELFDQAWWTAERRARWAKDVRTRNGRAFLPIIPLCERAETEALAEPDWPTIEASRLDRLRPMIAARVRAITTRLVRKRLASLRRPAARRQRTLAARLKRALAIVVGVPLAIVIGLLLLPAVLIFAALYVWALRRWAPSRILAIIVGKLREHGLVADEPATDP